MLDACCGEREVHRDVDHEPAEAHAAERHGARRLGVAGAVQPQEMAGEAHHLARVHFAVPRVALLEPDRHLRGAHPATHAKLDPDFVPDGVHRLARRDGFASHGEESRQRVAHDHSARAASVAAREPQRLGVLHRWSISASRR